MGEVNGGLWESGGKGWESGDNLSGKGKER